MVNIDSHLKENDEASCTTLEALLDSPSLNPSIISGEVNGSINGIVHTSTAFPCNTPTVTNTQNSDLNPDSLGLLDKRVLLKEICSELLYVLKEQDVNGFFTYPLPLLATNLKHEKILGLLDIEKKIHLEKYKNLVEFRHNVSNLFTRAIEYCHIDPVRVQDANRMHGIVQDWFNSLPDEYFLINLDLFCTELGNKRIVNEREANLKILNPDNNGIVSELERIQSIGDEVGPVHFGSHLLPCGGYREDRRNKVTPYTYLDYGPYYSFGPTYDSSASHCTPESNQLLLGTTWLPGRTPYVLGEHLQNRSIFDNLDSIKYLSEDDIISVLQKTGDQQLIQSLLVAQHEQTLNDQIYRELEEILPHPDTSASCVFSACLANMFSKRFAKTELDGRMGDDDKKLDELQVGEEAKDDTLNGADNVVTSQADDSVVDLVHVRDLDDLAKKALDSKHREESTACNYRNLLDESAKNLRALYCAQYLRLGDTSQTANQVSSTLRPSLNEVTLAHGVARRLVHLTKKIRPRDVVHPYAVRKAMGLNPTDYLLLDDVENDDGGERDLMVVGDCDNAEQQCVKDKVDVDNGSNDDDDDVIQVDSGAKTNVPESASSAS